MTESEFVARARTGAVVPIVRTMLADLHTPVSVYLALREEGKPSFLFETVERDERIGRHSFVGINPVRSLRQRKNGVLRIDGTHHSLLPGSIFDALASEMTELRGPGREVDGFTGGYVGYAAYDAVCHLEKLDGIADEESRFDLFTTIVRFDLDRQTLTFIHNVMIDSRRDPGAQFQEGMTLLDSLEHRLQRSVASAMQFRASLESLEESGSEEEFCRSVERARSYIREGEIFQVVLSRRATLSYSGDLFAVYRALRVINPSPYLFYLDFGETRLVGSSPEVLVKMEDDRIELHPIAGTRPRGRTESEDLRLETELLADEKERAEHLMLVDLGRNDLGRISSYGSVNVPVFMRVDRYSHVMHIVSRVEGRLRGGLSSLDALKACFPAGTVTGAPKVRAMEIIRELEPHPRGVYAGAVGVVGFNGSLDTCIAIRTIIGHGNRLTLQAGAGIVADSVPANEYNETVNKTGALLEALRMASDNGRKGGDR